MKQNLKKTLLLAVIFSMLAAAPVMADIEKTIPGLNTGESESETDEIVEADPGWQGGLPSKIIEENVDGDTESESNETDKAESNETDKAESNETDRAESETDKAESETDETKETEDDEDDTISWLSSASLLRIAVGVIIGLAAAAIIFAVWNAMNKREDASESADRALEDADQWTEPSDAEGIQMDAVFERTETDPKAAPELPDSSRGTIGKVHNIGRRRNQQDTLGLTHAGRGLLAVVSDGMGGLSDGERVSQETVKTMLQSTAQSQSWKLENPLYEMLAKTNDQVLRMLGPDKIYKSGATLLAVLVNNGQFHWVTVGDSHIYLYCGHHLIQLNNEHIYKRELLVHAVNRKISFSSVESDLQKSGLVSFLGMGDLKYIDGSLKPVDLLPGDKLLLMSDGIFNTISEKMIIRILESTKNAAEAAALMEQKVLEANNPKQDNFTCIILDF